MSDIADSAVARAIMERRSAKVFGDPANPSPTGGLSRAAIEGFAAIAGWAPFHHAAHDGHREAAADQPFAKEPWRVHMLDAAGCRAFAKEIDPADNPRSIIDMLSAADALYLVTWLPDPEEDGAEPRFSERNSEHLCSTGAFIQNLMLAATSADVPNYCSSGGVLRTPKYLAALGATPAERLLGAVFLFPRDLSGFLVKQGGMLKQRSGPSGWSRWAR